MATRCGTYFEFCAVCCLFFFFFFFFCVCVCVCVCVLWILSNIEISSLVKREPVVLVFLLCNMSAVGRSLCLLPCMHKSLVVPVYTGPGNSEVFNFLVFNFKPLFNALHFGDKFMVKSLLKASPPRDQFCFLEQYALCCKKSTCIFFWSSLLDTAIQRQSIIDSMSQVIRKLKFEVNVAFIYVCKAFSREINNPSHLTHCQDISEVTSRHLSPAMSPLSPAL